MDNTFTMFTPVHLMMVLANLGFGAILIIAAARTKNPRTEWAIRLFIVVSIWFIWVYLRIYRITHDCFSIQEDLPLHLCGFSSFLIPLMLLNKNQKLYQINYYWGLGGATQALMTPSITEFKPWFLFWEFFFTHSMIVIGAIYATVIFKYRPTFKGLVWTWVLTASLLLPIGLINKWIGANYFFIAHKPETASLLDFMGPWPFYLIPLSGLAVVIFLIFYIPFPIAAWVKKRRIFP